ncbi:hypothetical protein COFR110785_08700 [Corynebacterium frankenforstense]
MLRKIGIICAALITAIVAVQLIVAGVDML